MMRSQQMIPASGVYRVKGSTRSDTRTALYRRLGLVFLWTTILMLIITLVGHRETGLSERVVWFIAGAFGLLIILLMQQLLGLNWLNPLVLYAVIFWVFHFGLLFPASVSLNTLDSVSVWTLLWFYHPDTEPALLASLLFLACFALGVVLTGQHVGGTHYFTNDIDTPELVTVGKVVIGIGFLLFSISLFGYGWSIFLLRYQDFVEVSSSFSLPIVIMATGIMLQVAGSRDLKAILRTLGVLFVPIAAPVMLAGARTAPLFASAALLSVLTLRGLRISAKVLVPAVILLLVMIAVIKDVRQQGLGDVIGGGDRVVAQDPLAGLSEMGGSLAPVVASFDYIRERGDYFYGATYLLPFIRQIERFTGTRGTALTDERFIAETMTRRYGAFGFSTVAEAYVNGGIWGVALFALAWGVLLTWLTKRATTPYRLAILTAFLIPMFVNVRNSFIYVPAWVFLGLLPIAAGLLIRNRRQSRQLIRGLRMPLNSEK